MNSLLRRLPLLLVLLSPCLQAQDRGVGFYADQDMFLPFVNEDRDYTMGVAVEFFDESDDFFYPLDRAGRWVAKSMGVQAGDEPIYRSWMFGSINFTPDDLSATVPLTDDRPYASLLFFSNKRVQASNNKAVGVEVRVGLLGTALAGEVQSQLHGVWREVFDTTEPVDPKGWGNQISDGGEPTLRLRVAKSHRFLKSPGLWDLAYSWDLSLGYQTNASVGLSGRIGQIASPFWTIPFDPINRGNFLPAPGNDEWYVWGAYRTRAVGYDALLQGQFRDSVLTYGPDDLRRLVHEGAFGVTATWRRWQLTVAANAKTAELDLGEANRTHWWGGTYLTVSF